MADLHETSVYRIRVENTDRFLTYVLIDAVMKHE